jgi:phage tail-like protein
VYMLSNLYIPLKWWNFMGAFPIAWTGPAFNAGQGGVAVETLRIAYETMDHPTLGI